MPSGMDLYLAILIFAVIIFGLVAIIYLVRSMAIASKKQDLEESYRAIKVCADGTVTEVTYNYHELSIANNTDAELRVTLDRNEYLLEPGAVYRGSFGQGHHRIKVRNTSTNEIARIGFTLRNPDTLTIVYADGKIGFQ